MPLAVTSIEIQNVPRSWVQEGRCGQKKKWRRYKKWFAPDKKLSKYRFVQTSSRNLKFLAHCLRKQAERNWFHITEWLSASTKLDSILSSRFKFPPVPSLFTAPIPPGVVHKWHHWGRGGALCVQMDFTRTFEANTKCNNMKYVWSHFYQILVVLKYHRRLWNIIFDTDIFRCINTYIKGVYLAFFGIFMLLEMVVSKILFHRHLWCFRTTKIW